MYRGLKVKDYPFSKKLRLQSNKRESLATVQDKTSNPPSDGNLFREWQKKNFSSIKKHNSAITASNKTGIGKAGQIHYVLLSPFMNKRIRIREK